MTQTKLRFASFEEYLTWSDDPENYMEGRYELINGELVELPPESRFNSTIALRIFLALMNAGIPLQLIHPGKCEIQVPVLELGDAANRYPDLVVLREEHLDLTERRLTITRDMPPPQMVVEVASPGKANRERDYKNKLAQYQSLGINEYWIIDPKQKMLTVFELQQSGYQKIGEFRDHDPILSPHFPGLVLTVAQILA
jgi:Uma2 family endonuclease